MKKMTVRTLKDSVGMLIKHLVLTAYALTALVPFLWVLISAFKDNTSIFTRPFSLPASFAFDNFIRAWKVGGIGLFFGNSLFISLMTLLLQLFLVSMAAYALSRVFLAPLVMNYFLLGLMIPVHGTLIPDFLIVRSLGLTNSKFGVIIVMVSFMSFGIFLLSSFMRQIPRELDEAAMIDGAGYIRIFFNVILPVSKPGLATIATFSFLGSWNEFLFSSVILNKKENMTITLGINYLKGQYVTDYGLLCAGLLFTIVPVVIMYLIFQEQVVKGMTAGAIKG
jgi:raffinose/stachyose/melibiose transport system permease protein